MSEKNYYLHIDGKPVKVSKEVYQEYYRGERKEKYFMEDLKMERMEIEPETQTVRLIPGREDSYERLVEVGKQFGTPCAPLEDSVLLSVLLESMIHSLSPEEQEVIREAILPGQNRAGFMRPVPRISKYDPLPENTGFKKT